VTQKALFRWRTASWKLGSNLSATVPPTFKPLAHHGRDILEQGVDAVWDESVVNQFKEERNRVTIRD